MFRPHQLTKKILLSLLVAAPFFYATSCADLKRMDLLDAQAGLSRKDIKDMMIKDLAGERKKKEKEKEAHKDDLGIVTTSPSISKLMLSPPPPALGGDRIVTFSVTDQVSLKDVLIELGRVANIDIDIDPSISGGVIINAKNRPLKEVLDRIAALAGLRYSYKNGVLHFENDAPYMKDYFVDYLSGGSVWSDVESNLKTIISSAAPASSGSSGSTSSESITTNKSAGIISVFATEKQHLAAQKYLLEVEKNSSAQVLIEAKVIQITLKDTYKTGIDWSFNGKFGNGKSGTVSQSGTNISDGVISIPSGSILSGIFGKNVTGTINALEEFGVTKALSSPRVHAINNQKATISFTTKNVYFNVTNTQTGTTQSNNVVTTATSTKVEQETGISLDITPSINLKSNEITMQIKPELSSVTGTAKDPVNTGNLVPIVSSKKLETQVKIQSGNVIVIGGLMEQDNDNQDSGVPFIQRVPILGWLFKSVSKTSTVKETVIFIKATIINSNSAPNKIDRELQEKLDANKRQFIPQ